MPFGGQLEPLGRRSSLLDRLTVDEPGLSRSLGLRAGSPGKGGRGVVMRIMV